MEAYLRALVVAQAISSSDLWTSWEEIKKKKVHHLGKTEDFFFLGGGGDGLSYHGEEWT